MRAVTASLIRLLAATPLAAQERQHVVRPGDTLWDLAGQYLNDPFQWRAIFRANTGVVENPDLIYPAEVLVIPGAIADGRTRTADPDPLGMPVNGADVLGVPTQGQTPAPVRSDAGPQRTLFYRPSSGQERTDAGATILTEPMTGALPVKLAEYVTAPYLQDPGALAVQATFLRAIRDDRPGRGIPPSAHPQDRVYLNYGAQARPAIDERFLVADVGRAVEGADPTHRIIQPRGIVRIIELGADVIEAKIESQYGPIYPGQVVIPIADAPGFGDALAADVEGGYDLQGTLLEFLEEHPLYGPSEVAFIDLGRNAGVREGDVFQAYLPPRDRPVHDVGTRTLPTEIIATLRVVRVGAASATVKVDKVRRARLESGLPVVRVRKIP